MSEQDDTFAAGLALVLPPGQGDTMIGRAGGYAAAAKQGCYADSQLMGGSSYLEDWLCTADGLHYKEAVIALHREVYPEHYR